MDSARHRILQGKRFFEEEAAAYKGPDPLKIRCDFFSWLDNFPKEEITDIYIPLLEETLKLFINQQVYKQDPRYVNLWLKYSVSQPKPLEVMEYMHSKGLGTESALLYTAWAEELVRGGSLQSADSVFKMGLKMGDRLKSNEDLLKHYENFLKDVGKLLLSGKIHCPTCGTVQTPCPSNSTPQVIEEVKNWEWNPLKVGEHDDFTCELAYFEDENANQIRMYPRDKVYPGPGEEYCLEEVMAAEYEKKRKGEEARAKAEEEMRLRKEEQERQMRKEEEERQRMRKDESLAETPVQASIPLVTPNMFNVVENSLVNHTTFTAHTKEAMNVVQDMWSSPVPSSLPPQRSSFLPSSQNTLGPHLKPPHPAVPNPPAKFEIYMEDNAPQKPPKTPFQINDENVNFPSSKPAVRSSAKLRLHEPNDPENIPPGEQQDVLPPAKHDMPPPTQHENVFEVPRSKTKVQLFRDNGPDQLAKKMETQMKFPPSNFVAPTVYDDFSDDTCNTKAFDFVLPSSTPLHCRIQKPSNSISQTSEPSTSRAVEPSNLSTIFERSKEKDSRSSPGSLASQTKMARPGPLVDNVTETFDPFKSEVIEDLLARMGFPKTTHTSGYHVKHSNLPIGVKNIRLGTESYTVMGEVGKGAYAKVLKASRSTSGGDLVALKIEKPPCPWEYYIAKEIQARVPPSMAAAFMDITAAHIFNNGSILETPYAKYGTLINVINVFKEKSGNQTLDLGVILHLSLQLINIVEHLHKAKIIHADMKPDNIVLRALPSHQEDQPCLQLIDFGRCIDMSLFPPDSQFHVIFKTDDNKCIEMKENKPWSYQIDLQGLASIFHVLLCTEYMKVQKKNNVWQLSKPIPRHLRRELWNPIFTSLLNVNPATDLPFQFDPLRSSIQDVFQSSQPTFITQIKSFGASIKSKFDMEPLEDHLRTLARDHFERLPLYLATVVFSLGIATANRRA